MPTDMHRPRFHYAPDNWINDPIPFAHGGKFHVFLQYNPGAAKWGDMHWAHAMSDDLVHWKTMPIAIAPGPECYDKAGIFTGSIVESQGTFYAFYTAVAELNPLKQTQALATSRDLVTWRKHPANPLIFEPPPGFASCFRDPQVWRDGTDWWMLIGSELPDRKGGTALLYHSRDMLNWKYIQPIFSDDIANTGHEFECPDLIPYGKKHLLITSSGQNYAHKGVYRDGQFQRDSFSLLDGPAFYAGKSTVDDRGRRILFGWLREQRPEPEQLAAGWSGVVSLPRIIDADANGELRMTAPTELTALRDGPAMHCPSVQARNGLQLLPGISGAELEVIATLASDAPRFGLSFHCGGDGTQRLDFTFDRATQKWCDLPLKLERCEPLVIRAFIDHSVIETYVNDQVVQTRRHYSKDPAAVAVGLHVEGGQAIAENISAWEMKPVF